ncbi:uncharacterized protein BT62DRAFT_921728 [Guyanagaster necrorhizus]|uniref:Uncharacterized protein n=1 Tax=Guyanagaster necrorhizus TaxID=856835 RepID=A0A9P7VNI4_9AGAR|nr:uncharacterized protein BT62DRAFT_921728 [Guyanagaster necrorhizus MCA 3950]KAG7443798.1 hypothetical protein BT62DRAFT_921728 [Guyanagaster necrorhizus MCA 3950]
MSLCKDPATTSHLEHYKSELTRDKDLKESVFHACTAIEKEFHTNASKQSIYKVLKTITGWVQSEQGQLADARVIACNKGKGCTICHSHVTIDTESDDDEDDPDKVAVHSDSDTESIKMVIDEEASRAGWFLKFFKAKSSNVVTEDKHKEPYKIRVFACYQCPLH